jgi:hypothetical protein
MKRVGKGMDLYKRIGIFAAGFLLAFILLSLYANSPKTPQPETVLSSAPASPNAPIAPIAPPQYTQIPLQALPAVQVKRSLLGLEVRFQGGHVNYAGLTIVNDPRYQALTSTEKLVDSIMFQPLQAPPFLLLVAIAKSPNGAPVIIPGKFDILQKTNLNGFVLKDSQGRLFYYSGYVLSTPGWKNLQPGQGFQDKFCKVPSELATCSPQNIVTVVLKKPLEALKDIPYLGQVK